MTQTSAGERNICCCGASKWTKVIAWLQIVCAVFLIAKSLFNLISIGAIPSSEFEKLGVSKGFVYGLSACSLVGSLFGLFMGILLLKGTNQKRVSYLKAWVVYGIIAVVLDLVVIILGSLGYFGSLIGLPIATGVISMAVNIFTVVVVYIHINEINAGVFQINY